jgi:hypothetical protein
MEGILNVKEDITQKKVGCHMCFKDHCFCKQCGAILQGNLIETATAFADHHNRKIRCSEVPDEEDSRKEILEGDSQKIMGLLRFDITQKNLVVPVRVDVIKSLLARAESVGMLSNGCTNSANAARDEFLTGLGLEVRDRMLKVFREKASEFFPLTAS